MGQDIKFGPMSHGVLLPFAYLSNFRQQLKGRTIGLMNTGLHNIRGKFGTGCHTRVSLIGTELPSIKIFQPPAPELLRDD